MMLVLSVLISLVCGWVIAFLFFKAKKSISSKEIADKYILKELYLKLENDLKLLQQGVNDKDITILTLSKDTASKEQIIKNLEEKLESNKKEIESSQERFKTEFQNIANQIFNAESQKFLQLNKNNMDLILSPLKDKIDDFKKKVEEAYDTEARDKTSLKAEILHLSSLNKQVSEEANKLANALIGESKTQGDWGEKQLEMILEKSGLIRDVHYRKQASFNDGEGDKRPDYIINLPGDKHVVVDSKVSLVAYTKYCNSSNNDDRKNYLKENLLSITGHIKDLNSKNYHNLYQIKSLDYVFMFVPIEAAWLLANQENPDIYNEALSKNICPITGSNLWSAMRTISYIWKQESQKKNVLEIARQSGALYDKFVDFMVDLKEVGKKIDDAKDSYAGAMNKLYESKKKGDTLIGRVEKIKELGAKATKALSKEDIDKIQLDEELHDRAED